MLDVIHAVAGVAGACVAALLSLGVLALIFVPLELAFRGRPHRRDRSELRLDLTFFFWQHVVWTGAVAAGLAWVGELLDPHLDPRRTFLAAVPWWLQAAVAWVLGDLCAYWGHRFQHRVGVLWRFHRVHHTATSLDWLAAFREHPLDGLYTRAVVNLPALLMGFSLASIAGLLTFRGLWAIFIHSNVGLRVGPLKYLVGAPSLHHWHHGMDRSGQCNFANLMPLWDLVFGTYHEPDSQPRRFGVPDNAPMGYLRHLVHPLK